MLDSGVGVGCSLISVDISKLTFANAAHCWCCRGSEEKALRIVGKCLLDFPGKFILSHLHRAVQELVAQTKCHHAEH